MPSAIRLEIPNLALPRMNVVLRWNRFRRAKETKRVRQEVSVEAALQGLGKLEPFDHASVEIVACGPYHRRDGDATYFKDILDALVARPVAVLRDMNVRRWGLLVDDSPKVIGTPRLAVRNSGDAYKVIVIVTPK